MGCGAVSASAEPKLKPINSTIPSKIGSSHSKIKQSSTKNREISVK
jgi:hypothetical protein